MPDLSHGISMLEIMYKHEIKNGGFVMESKVKSVNKIGNLNAGDEVFFKISGHSAQGIIETVDTNTGKVVLKNVAVIGNIELDFTKSSFKKIPIQMQKTEEIYDIFYVFEEDEIDLDIEIGADNLTEAIKKTIKVLDEKGFCPRDEDDLSILIPGKGRVKIVLKPNHH